MSKSPHFFQLVMVFQSCSKSPPRLNLILDLFCSCPSLDLPIGTSLHFCKNKFSHIILLWTNTTYPALSQHWNFLFKNPGAYSPFIRNHSFQYWIAQLGFGAFLNIWFWPSLEVAFALKGDSRPVSNEALSKLQKSWLYFWPSRLRGWVYRGVHYKERWSTANGCNRATFVLAVCSCWSSDGVISAHFLITTLSRCSRRDWLSECPGETHLEAQRERFEETQERGKRWKSKRGGGSISCWMQPWFMQGDTRAAAGHACCWDYTQLAAGLQLPTTKLIAAIATISRVILTISGESRSI